MAKIPTIAAYSYKKSIGQPFLYPDNQLDLIENFLTMMFAVPSEPYTVSPTVVHALKQLLILHADHEQNCSTSTVRMVGSSSVNLFSSISAGICALWGALHGGANEACIDMLEQIYVDNRNLGKYIDRAKDPNDEYRLMGFGRSLVPFGNGGDRSVIHSSVQLQGSLKWETMWQAMVESAERFNLTKIRLNLFLPRLHEDFFATWQRKREHPIL